MTRAGNAFGGTAAIVGIGATEFSKRSGRSELQLACEAVLAALDDAGLPPESVDGMVTFSYDTNPEIEIARNIGAGDLTFFSRIPYGGGGPCATILQAMMAISAGVAKVVVCYRAFNERSEARFGDGSWRDPPAHTAEGTGFSTVRPNGLMTPAQWVAIIAQRYMYETGATTEDFGRVSVLSRKHAATNPKAWFYQRPIQLEDHQQSRWISEPLRLLDCCQESDGAQAFVLVSTEMARSLRQTPVVVKAASQGSPRDMVQMTPYYGPEIARLPEMRIAAAQLWDQSGLGPGEIDAAILYDHFSPYILMQLEALGFCAFGEAGSFVADSNLELTGRLPTNTHGGQLGEAYIHGMNGVAEGVRLVRGESVNQPPAPIDNVVVTGGPAVPTSACVLGR